MVPQSPSVKSLTEKLITELPMSNAGGGSLVWSRTAACHAAGPGSNPGHRTTILILILLASF